VNIGKWINSLSTVYWAGQCRPNLKWSGRVRPS
jgi:hypothetical protein